MSTSVSLSLVLSSLVLLVVAPSTCFGYSSGAGTCFADRTIITNGMGTPLATGNGGFSFSTTSTNYTAGGPNIVFTLSGTPPATQTFKGILLYGVSPKGNRVGTFVGFNSFFQPQTLSGCSNAATITHTSSDVKSLPYTFTWAPPSTAAGDVTFNIAVVRGSQADWYILPTFTLSGPPDKGGVASSSSFHLPSLLVWLGLGLIAICVHRFT